MGLIVVCWQRIEFGYGRTGEARKGRRQLESGKFDEGFEEALAE